MSAIKPTICTAPLPASAHTDDIGPGHQTSTLYTASNPSVVVVDIPRSIEEAQVLPGQPSLPRRLLSSDPRTVPWILPESKAAPANSKPHPAVIAELMIAETCLTVLENVRKHYAGNTWHLPRVVSPMTLNALPSEDSALHEGKRKAEVMSGNKSVEPQTFIPKRSYCITGDIHQTRNDFISKTVTIKFDLIVLDPPWPSRSARRKKSGNNYATVSNMTEARDLLTSIPVSSRLSPEGIVAIWITNKPAVYDSLVGPGGVFAQWGVELVGEWIWLKITAAGEPIFDIHSDWRKPWERLLLARPKSVGRSNDERRITLEQKRIIPTKVVLAVPDLHSRKPNLRGLLQELLVPNYLGLEVFARNLTAGWWAWGNEALLFQSSEHWMWLNDHFEETREELNSEQIKR